MLTLGTARLQFPNDSNLLIQLTDTRQPRWRRDSSLSLSRSLSLSLPPRVRLQMSLFDVGEATTPRIQGWTWSLTRMRHQGPHFSGAPIQPAMKGMSLQLTSQDGCQGIGRQKIGVEAAFFLVVNQLRMNMRHSAPFTNTRGIWHGKQRTISTPCRRRWNIWPVAVEGSGWEVLRPGNSKWDDEHPEEWPS